MTKNCCFLASYPNDGIILFIFTFEFSRQKQMKTTDLYACPPYEVLAAVQCQCYASKEKKTKRKFYKPKTKNMAF